MGYEFLYVFSEEDKDKLLQMGFVLMKEDKANSVFIFKSKDIASFENFGIRKCYMTDVLTF